MPRHGGSGGTHSTTKQKGHKRGRGRGAYSRKQKARNAARLERILLTGNYTSLEA